VPVCKAGDAPAEIGDQDKKKKIKMIIAALKKHF
jgi:hypothetical protein